MAMNVGNANGRTVAPAMNVTPLVDVVLVLLIIFMVITPLLTKKLWVHMPKQEKEEVTRQELEGDPDPPLVLHLAADGTIRVNDTVVPFDDLAARLRRFFAARDDHVLFFDADADAEYGRAVEVMDRAREGGAVTIATLTEGLAATPDAAGAAPPPAQQPRAAD
ncbi:MAG: biopolymer transporter ExbD [Thermodesulfobacteriota bacterium]